jgi:2-polyprenyl-3-methyl-5-hydroxy-6-metoxy-1,4-benzoquinol methylase
MDMIAKYDTAAPEWEQKIHRLGYWGAYSGFLKDRTIHSGSVLDAGTGTGAFAQAWIVENGSKVLTLVDPSGVMLAKAQANLASLMVEPRTVKSQLEDFNPSSRFQTILAAHVIEHCDDPKAALRLFADWLQPDGNLFLVTSKPHWCNWLIWFRYRHRWFSENQIRQTACAVGLNHTLTHKFQVGPPSFTSLAYIFSKS